jgi:hypothetical protein
VPSRKVAQGKTQLVLNYVDRNHDLYALCVWVGVDTLQESCAAVAAELGVETDAAHAVAGLGAFLAKYRGTKLVVLDNADTVRWAELAPLAETGHVVVTTRNRALLEMASQGGQIELSTLSEPQALELLGVDASAAGAVELVRALGCLPLALAHARSSITSHKKTPEELLASLRAAEASGGADLARVYSRETLAVLNMSVRNAAEACAERGVPGEAARRLAVACGYLHAEAVPRWFLEEWLDSQCDVRGAAAETILEQLVQFSILSVRASRAATSGDGDDYDQSVEYDMHRIQQAAMRALDSAWCPELRSLLQYTQAAFQYDDTATDHPRTAALAPHVQCISDHAVACRERLGQDLSLHTRVLYTLGRWYTCRGAYEKVRRRVCRIRAREVRIAAISHRALPCSPCASRSSGNCWT